MRAIRASGAALVAALAAVLALAGGCQPAAPGGEAATETPAREPAPDPAAVAALDGPFDPAREPEADLQLAMEEARRSGRRIMLDVGGEGCSRCHRLDAFLRDDPEMLELRDAGYVWMKVNSSEDNDNAPFLARFPDIKAYPHLFVLDADGKLLHSQSIGELELEQDEGYDRDKFDAFLRAWTPSADEPAAASG